MSIKDHNLGVLMRTVNSSRSGDNCCNLCETAWTNNWCNSSIYFTVL